MKQVQKRFTIQSVCTRLPRMLTLALLIGSTVTATNVFAQTPPPPTMGQETKGEPAVDETKPLPMPERATEEESEASNSAANRLFGSAIITESRRESGQVYLIEIEHSSGSKQYIEEFDSDGKIEFKDNDIEQTPNLPKWKIGSW